MVSSVTDLGVSYDSHLCFRPHINKIVSKASQRAKLILKCFVSRDPTILSKAFCVFVRPILEFSSVIWNPGFKVDIDKFESVEKRFTRACLPHLAYAESLAQLNLLTLETRRVMTDLITCYKLLNGELDVDCYSSIHSSDVTQTRGNTTQQVFVMQTCFTTVLLIPGTNCLTVLCWPLACLLSRLVYINLLYCKYWLTVILYSFVICNVVRI